MKYLTTLKQPNDILIGIIIKYLNSSPIVKDWNLTRLNNGHAELFGVVSIMKTDIVKATLAGIVKGSEAAELPTCQACGSSLECTDCGNETQ